MKNLYASIGLIIRLSSLGVILLYIIPKQIREVMRPKNWLSRLRWQILALFLFTIFSAVPGLTYQYLRSVGQDSPVLRNISSVTGNLSSLATTILLVLIYNYKKHDK